MYPVSRIVSEEEGWECGGLAKEQGKFSGGGGGVGWKISNNQRGDTQGETAWL